MKPKVRESGVCRLRCFRAYLRKPTPTTKTATCAPSVSLCRPFPASRLPNVVGPFSNYDFRVYAQQNVVDLESYRGFKASERALDAGKMDEQDAHDLIVRAIAALYLNAQSAAARANAAQSRVTDSSTLLKLARDKHDAGTATGVDVLRAQVQLANDKQALLVAQNQ